MLVVGKSGIHQPELLWQCSEIKKSLITGPAAVDSNDLEGVPFASFPEDFRFCVQNSHSLKFHFPKFARGSEPPKVYFFLTVHCDLGKTLVD